MSVRPGNDADIQPSAVKVRLLAQLEGDLGQHIHSAPRYQDRLYCTVLLLVSHYPILSHDPLRSVLTPALDGSPSSSSPLYGFPEFTPRKPISTLLHQKSRPTRYEPAPVRSSFKLSSTSSAPLLSPLSSPIRAYNQMRRFMQRCTEEGRSTPKHPLLLFGRGLRRSLPLLDFSDGLSPGSRI